jgi:glycosyltransferase involved in cell wall biosynthesis
MRPPVSLIVVFHSGVEYLKACLNSLFQTSRTDDEIIVIANNHDENALDLPSFGPTVHVIKFTQSLGHAGAANAGAKSASKNFLVFCDHDMIFQKDWLEHLWESYSAVPNAGACSCKAINPHSMAVLDFGIAFSDFNGAHPGLDLPQWHPLVSEDRIVQAMCSCGFLISSKDFFSAGQFDERFGSLYTDLDLCLQLKRMHRPLVVSARALALHFGSEIHLAHKKLYKESYKADIKGAFMRKHADVLAMDLDGYFSKSINYYISKYGLLKKYLACNLMNVADPEWYENQLALGGMKNYEFLHIPSGQRDAMYIGLFERLGFDIMRSNTRIAYFVDRISSISGNEYWWSYRTNKGDIVIDRNANVMPIEHVLSGKREINVIN